jgi:type I restriction enzyme, S subunit
VRPRDISSFKTTVPTSSKEQRRIVAEIEKQFTRLEAGVTALRRVQANLKRYRAAVLKSACEGKLVPTEAELAKKQKRKFESGEELLARLLIERRKNWTGRGKYKAPETIDNSGLPSLPDSWAYASVEQLGFVQLGRQRAPQHHKGRFMRPYLRVANVFEDRIDLSDVKEMNFTPEEFETFRLKPNDILLNEGQSLELVGRPAIYRGELPGACFTNTLVRFRPCASLSVKFAFLVFRAFMHSGRFQKIAKWTTNIAHLGADRFAKLGFPLPPLAEQTRIVAEVERRLSVVEELEAAVAVNLQRAIRLRQSILQKAFTGTL